MSIHDTIRRAGIILLTAWAAAAFAQTPAAATAPAAAAAPGAGGFELVTESEAAAWSSAKPESADFKTRDLREDGAAPNCLSRADNDADNPRIRIVAPILEKPLLVPVDIDLQFVPVGAAHIRPETFRVCYLGSVAMDITKRITDRAAVSEQGLHVAGVRLPRGAHRLVLLVADQRGRLARHEAVFNVL